MIESSKLKNLSLEYALSNILPVAAYIVQFIEEIESATFHCIENRNHITEQDVLSISNKYTKTVDALMTSIDGAYFSDNNPINTLVEAIRDDFACGHLNADTSKPIFDVTCLYALFSSKYPLIAKAYYSNQDQTLERSLKDTLDFTGKAMVELPVDDHLLLMKKEICEGGNLGFAQFHNKIYVYGITRDSKEELERYVFNLLMPII